MKQGKALECVMIEIDVCLSIWMDGVRANNTDAKPNVVDAQRKKGKSKRKNGKNGKNGKKGKKEKRKKKRVVYLRI